MLKLQELLDKMKPEKRAEYDKQRLERTTNPIRHAFTTMISHRQALDATYSQATSIPPMGSTPTKPQ